MQVTTRFLKLALERDFSQYVSNLGTRLGISGTCKRLDRIPWEDRPRPGRIGLSDPNLGSMRNDFGYFAYVLNCNMTENCPGHAHA